MDIKDSNINFLEEVVERFDDVELKIVIGLKNLKPTLFTKLTKTETIEVFEGMLASLKAPKKEEEKQVEEQFPKTIEEAVDYYIAKCDFSEVKDLPVEEFCAKLHHGLRQMIRNEMGLWKQDDNLAITGMVKKMMNMKTEPHPDDVSSLIVNEIYKKLKQTK